MTLIDSHTHLDRFHRTGELPDILSRAAAAGVTSMIAIGTEPDDWRLYRELVAGYPGTIYYTVGLHPCSVDQTWESAVEELSRWLDTGGAKPVAIGETGLDRFHLPKNDEAAAASLFEMQKASFRAHLRVATGLGLPVVVHSRGAAMECVEEIDASGFDWSRVVFHCFVEGPDVMSEITSRGGRGSFTGIVTYKNAQSVRDAALSQGLDRLMVETDAPYLAPVPHRGERNEPAYVAFTAVSLADAFGVPPEVLAETTTRNARAFFAL